MLNATRVLKYIKDNLAFPFNFIEIDDPKIMEYVTEYTVREFSYYIPQVRRMNLNLTLATNRVPGRSNEYFLYDPQGLEILNVVDIYFDEGNLILHGHPPLGPLSFGEVKEWALAVATSMQVKVFSSWDYTNEFIHPNIVRISPAIVNAGPNVTVEYERMQPPDFRGIPNEFQVLFCEMALADIMILIGRIRKKYGDGTLRTPFGEIPLSAEVGDEGKDKKREIVEKLIAGALPNVIIDHG